MNKILGFLSGYAKMHTALIGGVVTALVTHFPGAWWLPFVTLGATALGVGAVGNSQPAPAPAPAPAPRPSEPAAAPRPVQTVTPL